MKIKKFFINLLFLPLFPAVVIHEFGHWIVGRSINGFVIREFGWPRVEISGKSATLKGHVEFSYIGKKPYPVGIVALSGALLNFLISIPLIFMLDNSFLAYFFGVTNVLVGIFGLGGWDGKLAWISFFDHDEFMKLIDENED